MKVLAINHNYSAFEHGSIAEFEPSIMVNLNEFPWTEYATKIYTGIGEENPTLL